MTLLIKAGMDTGLDIRYYTMYAHLGGGATAIGPAGNGKVRSVMSFHENIAVETGKTDTEGWTGQFRARRRLRASTRPASGPSSSSSRPR